MAKPDFPALLQPGVHALTLAGLHAIAVAPFTADVRRQDLFQKLTTWASALRALNVGGILWVDGSFLTEKPGPDDIDCVLWNPGWTGAAAGNPVQQQQVQQLLDRASAEALFELDLYLGQH